MKELSLTDIKTAIDFANKKVLYWRMADLGTDRDYDKQQTEYWRRVVYSLEKEMENRIKSLDV